MNDPTRFDDLDSPVASRRGRRGGDAPRAAGAGLRLRWLLAGCAALAWLLWRSGSKPSRLGYPCQQAAFSTAALVFGAPVAAGAVGVRQGWLALTRSPSTWLVSALGLVVALGVWADQGRRPAYAGPVRLPAEDYRAQVFDVTNKHGPAGEHFAGLEDLVETMGAGGLKLYRSSTPSLTAGPVGILGHADVVVIKINYQWPERGGTNVDLLRGLIRRILDHPDGFTGEVVVAENAQFNSIDNFDRAENNAVDPALSPHDVVVAFQAQGHQVSHFDWTTTRFTSVDEYSSGDLRDGYVVYPYDAALNGRKSYPKFRTTYGTWISMRDGIWSESEGYDRARLKRINLPVLKSHHATYGATACVKNYMGLVTRELSTNSHGAIHYGLLGAVIGDLGPADLNILDATWINADPYDGPWTTYEAALETDRLVASLDPVAADIWAVKNVLLPGFAANGYSPPWPSPSADPDNPTSAFRQYLDHSMSYLLAAGHEVTNDLTKIDVVDLVPPGEASPPDGPGPSFTIGKASGGGYDLAWSDPVRGGTVEEYNLYGAALAVGSAPDCAAPLGNGTSAFLASLPDDHAFVVVGRNGAGDGSFGRDGDGHERPSPDVPDVCP